MTATGSDRRVWAALGIVYLVWGSTYLAIRVAVETIPPFLMAATRFLVAGGLLYAWSVRRGDVAGDRVGPVQWRAAALIGGLLLVCGNGALSWAEQRVPSGVAALIVATVPLWMVILAGLRREERLRARVVAGLAVGFAGTGLLVVVSQSSGGGRLRLSGLLVVVGASICWAAGSVLSRTANLPRRPLVSTAMQMLAGGAMLLVLAAATGEFRSSIPRTCRPLRWPASPT